MSENTTIHEKLMCIQKKLKVPKNQFNAFGKYHYRSCEDILEAVKPLLEDCHLTIWDELVQVGDRYYIKAWVELSDGVNKISVTAFAREEENKKGMDASQITGTASSYARKYGLNGLFLIDDTKDADTQDNTGKDKGKQEKTQPAQSDIRKVLEIKIQEAKMDRDMVKDYLASVGWITEKDGRLSMTTLSDKNVKVILDKWDSFSKKLNEWVDKQNAYPKAGE